MSPILQYSTDNIDSMSQRVAAQDEAGPSSDPPRYDRGVRRCKTVSCSSSTRSHPHQLTASTIAGSSVLDGLALPIDLDRPSSERCEAVSPHRDPAVSPSRRGETLRAYSCQRRLFSSSRDRPVISPEQLPFSFPPASPISPVSRKLHPAHTFVSANGTSGPTTSSLLFPHSNQSADTAGIDATFTTSRLESFGDEPASSMSSTPSLTSPTSTLSRSASLRSAASECPQMISATRYLSLNGSADLCKPKEPLLTDYPVSNWTRRARRWSNTLSRRMSISALNQTIHSTTTPYLKAGLQELRSIFDVDTLGVAVDDEDDTDLEGASPSDRSTHLFSEQDRLALFGPAESVTTAAFSHQQAFFESPKAMSTNLSRENSSEHRELPLPSATNWRSIEFTSQVYPPPVTHRRAQSWRKHRSLSSSNLFNQPLLTPSSNRGATSDLQRASSRPVYLPRDTSARSQLVRTPLVAVGLAALTVMIVGVCAFENSIHPDAATLPLTTFMLAQSLFGLVGISGLALQKRWIIDLASRLLRAHVLCQVLIVLAALRSLSRTAFYRDRFERHTVTGTAAAGMLTSPRFFTSTGHASDAHTSLVGSFSDQVTYVCVFVVQAALPLTLALWAQYAVASALSLTTRSLPCSSDAAKAYSEPQRSAPAVTASKGEDYDVAGNARMRFNSENTTLNKGSSQNAASGAVQRSQGWLGFVITRLDVNKVDPTSPKFDLDAAELTTRLESLAAAEMSTRNVA